MTYYTIAIEKTQCHGHGDYTNETMVCMLGDWGKDGFPPLFKDPIVAEDGFPPLFKDPIVAEDGFPPLFKDPIVAEEYAKKKCQYSNYKIVPLKVHES